MIFEKAPPAGPLHSSFLRALSLFRAEVDSQQKDLSEGRCNSRPKGIVDGFFSYPVDYRKARRVSAPSPISLTSTYRNLEAKRS